MIKIVKKFFNNKVFLIKIKKFNDVRGFFFETYNHRDLISHGIKEKFLQDNESFSIKKGTIRGLHFQREPNHQSKLLSVKKGSIQDVVLDVSKKSKTFGKHISIKLSEHDNYLLYIPKGFAHGFCTLVNNTIVHYKTSNYYYPAYEVSIDFNDPFLNINWKVNSKIVMSKRDLNSISFEEYKMKFL